MFPGVPGALVPAIAAAAGQEDPGEVTWTREEGDWDTDLSLTFEQRYERTFPSADLERLRVDVERGDVSSAPRTWTRSRSPCCGA